MMKGHRFFQRNYLFLIGFIVFIFCYPMVSKSADAIGKVVWVNGLAKATGLNGIPRSLERRSPIYEKDTILTTKDSMIQFVFNDNTLLTLRGDTTLTLDQYSYHPNGSSSTEKNFMSLIKGGFRTVTGLISKRNPDNYQVTTPVATIGVRGTDYTVFYEKKSGLELQIISGTIAVSNAAGNILLSQNLGPAFAHVASVEKPPVKQSTPPAELKTLLPTTTPVTSSGTGSPTGTAPSSNSSSSSNGSASSSSSNSTTNASTSGSTNISGSTNTISTSTDTAPAASAPKSTTPIGSFCIQ